MKRFLDALRRRLPRRFAAPRATLALLLTCGALGAGCPGEPDSPAPATRARLAGGARGWNVVVLSIDTLRADRLGAFGYTVRPTSPALDEQARSGVRFRAAMSQRAATWPSLATMLSGLYPSGHGVLGNGYAFPEDVPTLPKVLREAGYQTGAFLSNMCSAGHSGWDQFRCTSSNDARANRAALEWAGAADPSRPFLLWVHYFGPHPPYFNGGDRAAELDPGYAGALAPKKNVLDAVMLARRPLGARDVSHLDALYDAAVMGTDRRAAELFEGLRAAGRLDRTLVMVLADHGEELYEHNRYFYHSCSVYQSTLHVPLWFSAPGLIEAGGEVRQPVEIVDVLPTLLELLGTPAPQGLQGSSLVPYLERPASAGAGKPAYSEYDVSQIRTVLADGWKLVDNPENLAPDCVPGAAPGFYPIARTELYDLRADPGERNNLAGSQPAKVVELRGMIAKRFAGLADRRHKQTIPKGLSEELKSLGYVAN